MSQMDLGAIANELKRMSEQLENEARMADEQAMAQFREDASKLGAVAAEEILDRANELVGELSNAASKAHEAYESVLEASIKRRNLRPDGNANQKGLS